MSNCQCVCCSKALDQPPTDELYGLRVHAWVLVLDGKREVPEPFFIEPLTGQAHPINSQKYLGIESVWNHRNYWVNMQDCSDGVQVCLLVDFPILLIISYDAAIL